MSAVLPVRVQVSLSISSNDVHSCDVNGVFIDSA